MVRFPPFETQPWALHTLLRISGLDSPPPALGHRETAFSFSPPSDLRLKSPGLVSSCILSPQEEDSRPPGPQGWRGKVRPRGLMLGDEASFYLPCLGRHSGHLRSAHSEEKWEPGLQIQFKIRCERCGKCHRRGKCRIRRRRRPG